MRSVLCAELDGSKHQNHSRVLTGTFVWCCTSGARLVKFPKKLFEPCVEMPRTPEHARSMRLLTAEKHLKQNGCHLGSPKHLDLKHVRKQTEVSKRGSCGTTQYGRAVAAAARSGSNCTRKKNTCSAAQGKSSCVAAGRSLWSKKHERGATPRRNGITGSML